MTTPARRHPNLLGLPASHGQRLAVVVSREQLACHLVESRPGVLVATDRRGIDPWESPQMKVLHWQVKLARCGLIDVHVYGYADGGYVAKPSSRHPLP